MQKSWNTRVFSADLVSAGQLFLKIWESGRLGLRGKFQMDSSTRTVNKNTTSATPMLSHHWRYNSRYAGLFLTFITAALLFLCPSKSLGKIVSVAMLSRHGTRAANEVLMNSCPNYRPNFDSYLQLMHIQPGGLTPKGMQTLYDLGEFTRKRYIEKTQLLEERYTSVDIRVQAVDAERTLQSAEIWGDAMYPQNSGSPLYARVSIDPTPLPIYVTPDDLDDVLEPRKATCAAQINHDTRMWDAEVRKLCICLSVCIFSRSRRVTQTPL